MQYTKQHIFLSGSVGVGKTTALKTFNDEYGDCVSCIVIKEYIDYDEEGEARLEAFTKGNLPLYDFQVYILDMLEQQLNCDDYESARVVVWERHPEEALEIFSTEMDEKHKEKLLDRIEMMSRVYEFPLLKDRKKFAKLTFNTLDVSDVFIADVIYDVIKASISVEAVEKVPKVMYIFLYIPNFNIGEHYKRILKRGRVSEIDKFKNMINLASLNMQYLEFIKTIGK